MLKKRFGGGTWIVLAVAILGVALIATATPAQADLFNFTSCHLSDGCGTATQFGTVELKQSGSNVTFDVVLNPGNRFVETGAGGGGLFLFNDTIASTSITNISVTLNGATVTISGGLTGLINQPPIHADGTGDFTAIVKCTLDASCNGGSTPNINDLHFTVTGATLAQLETKNPDGNFFIADILCGQTGCTGLTGPVDVSTGPVPVPEPTTLLMVGTVLVGLGAAWRRRRSQSQRVLAV